MLYIKTATAAKRLDKPGARTVAAEDVRLVPSDSDQRLFRLKWNDDGLFAKADTTPEGKLCYYESYRHSFRQDIGRDPDTQAAIERIRDDVRAGKDVILTVRESRKFPNSIRRLLVELFYENGVTGIESDRGIDPQRVRLMDVLSTEPMVNTEFSYYYTDNTGETATTRTVIAGRISDEQITRILSACKDGKWFVPKNIGLPLNRPSDYTPYKDHMWAKFFDDSDMCFRPVNASPDHGCTIADMVKLFEKSAPHWDTIAKTEKLLKEGKI